MQSQLVENPNDIVKVHVPFLYSDHGSWVLYNKMPLVDLHHYFPIHDSVFDLLQHRIQHVDRHLHLAPVRVRVHGLVDQITRLGETSLHVGVAIRRI